MEREANKIQKAIAKRLKSLSGNVRLERDRVVMSYQGRDIVVSPTNDGYVVSQAGKAFGGSDLTAADFLDRIFAAVQAAKMAIRKKKNHAQRNTE